MARLVHKEEGPEPGPTRTGLPAKTCKKDGSPMSTLDPLFHSTKECVSVTIVGITPRLKPVHWHLALWPLTCMESLVT